MKIKAICIQRGPFYSWCWCTVENFWRVEKTTRAVQKYNFI